MEHKNKKPPLCGRGLWNGSLTIAGDLKAESSFNEGAAELDISLHIALVDLNSFSAR